MNCTRRVHFHRQARPQECADGRLRHICMCGEIRFTEDTIVLSYVIKDAT